MVPTVLEHFPEDSHFIMLPGEDAEWNCTVEASSMATLEWHHDGTPISALPANESQNCSDFVSEDKPSIIIVLLVTESLGVYVSQYSAILLICGASHSTAGSFQAVLDNEDGTVQELGTFVVTLNATEGVLLSMKVTGISNVVITL